jgi:hypothetical protein
MEKASENAGKSLRITLWIGPFQDVEKAPAAAHNIR